MEFRNPHVAVEERGRNKRAALAHAVRLSVVGADEEPTTAEILELADEILVWLEDE